MFLHLAVALEVHAETSVKTSTFSTVFEFGYFLNFGKFLHLTNFFIFFTDMISCAFPSDLAGAFISTISSFI